MTEKRYILIDKKIIQLNKKFDFDIYYPIDSKESIDEQHHLVSSHNHKALYISQEDQRSYKIFHNDSHVSELK